MQIFFFDFLKMVIFRVVLVSIEKAPYVQKPQQDTLPATPKSDIMHQELMSVNNIDEAQAVAISWLQSMVQIFHSMCLEKRSKDFLCHEVR